MSMLAEPPDTYAHHVRITVAELKKLLLNWPETDEHGNPCEVWIGSADGYSNQAKECHPLNARTSEDGINVTADLIIEF